MDNTVLAVGPEREPSKRFRAFRLAALSLTRDDEVAFALTVARCCGMLPSRRQRTVRTFFSGGRTQGDQ